MSDEKIRYVLDVDDKGTPKIVKFGEASEKAGKKASSSFASAGAAVQNLGEKIPGLSGAMGVLSGGPMMAAAAGTAAVVGGFGAMVMHSVNAADGMNDLSLRLGISTERLSVLSLYAEQSGTDIDTLAKAMGKLGAKVAGGDETLKKMGVTASSTDEALFQVADKIAATEAPMLRLKLATDAFGKSGQEMLPLLVQGGDALRKMGGNAAIVTTEMAQMSDEFNDNMAAMKAQVANIGLNIASAVLPHMMDWLDGVDKIRKGMGEIFGIQSLLTAGEQRTNERNAIIEQYGKLQEVKASAAAKGYISAADALKPVLIDGKTLLASLKAFDAANAPKEEPKTNGGHESEAEAAARLAAAKKSHDDAVAAANQESARLVAHLQSVEENREKFRSDSAALELADRNAEISALNKEADARARLWAVQDAAVARSMEIQQQVQAVEWEIERGREDAYAEEQKALSARLGMHNSTLTSMLQGEMSWHDARQKMWQETGASIINKMLEVSEAWIADQIMRAAFADAARAETVAANGATAATLTAQDATPAALAATMSFGSAAIIGGAALAGIIAMAASYDVGTPSVNGNQLANIHDRETILPTWASIPAQRGDWGPAMRFMGQGGSSSTTSTSSQTNHITVNVAGTNASPDGIAKSLSRALQVQQRKGARSSF